jgi:hypothetical protein
MSLRCGAPAVGMVHHVPGVFYLGDFYLRHVFPGATTTHPPAPLFWCARTGARLLVNSTKQ